jgi:colicin import membrane protein
MRQSLSIGREPSLQRLVVTSTILHLFLIAVIFVPFKTGDREFKAYYVNLVGPVKTPRIGRPPVAKKSKKKVAAKKRVAIKRKTAAPENRTKEISKAVPKKSLKPSTRITKEIERIRAISELSKKRREERETTQEVEVVKKRIYDSSQKGAGIPGKGEHMDSDSYYALITQKIWSEWIYPDFGSARFEVIVSIKIDSEGKVVSQAIEETSGNMLFDRSALKAISKASPLPPPPVEMEIGVRFYL